MAKQDREWSAFANEFKVCKRKLESKGEALKILMKDLEDCQVQRDIYKNKAYQLEQELGGLKDIVNEYFGQRTRASSWNEESDCKSRELKTFMQLLQKSKEENEAFKHDLSALRQLYSEAQRDNQLLREAMAKCQSQERDFSHERQNKEGLVIQMEEAQNKIEELQGDLKFVTDELAEVRDERDHFKDKVVRLNTQLNHILHNSDDRLIDVDAVVLENNYLKEVIKQYKEEKAIATAGMLKYKNALQKRIAKGGGDKHSNDLKDYFRKEGQQTSGKHVASNAAFTSATVEELHKVTRSLTEALTEKDLSLMHQRNTNRALGTRVRELERKLKTLEVSGLWNSRSDDIRDASDLITGGEDDTECSKEESANGLDSSRGSLEDSVSSDCDDRETASALYTIPETIESTASASERTDSSSNACDIENGTTTDDTWNVPDDQDKLAES